MEEKELFFVMRIRDAFACDFRQDLLHWNPPCCWLLLIIYITSSLFNLFLFGSGDEVCLPSRLNNQGRSNAVVNKNRRENVFPFVLMMSLKGEPHNNIEL